MNVKIRHATIEDASAIAKVNIASWQSTYRGLIADATLDVMTFEEYLKKWENILLSHKKDNFCLVAKNEEGEIIGYSICGKNRHEKFPFEAELFAIYLLKDYQGQGIGKTLFLESIEELKKRRINSLLLFVLTSNSGSRKFYESFAPDFTTDELITIDNNQYSDTCYGWSDISLIGN